MPYKNPEDKRKYNLNYAQKHKKEKAAYDRLYRDKKKLELVKNINN